MRNQIPELFDPEKLGIFIREIKAHRECIVSMTKISLNIGGFVTTSIDRRIRLWSQMLDLWGTIDQSSSTIEKIGILN
jgi:hypothetical protein